MSYPMVHMECAYRAMKELDGIHSPGSFLLGAVAPDAVHFHDPYQVSLKEQSHIWDCGPRWGLTLESGRWLENIRRFWVAHRQDEDRDFIAGYCAHLLVDWLNDRRVWSPFRDRIFGGQSQEKFQEDIYGGVYEEYRKEAHGYDQWLYQNSENSAHIWELLGGQRPCSVRGLIMKEDVERQQRSILTEQYVSEKSYDIDGYTHCTRQVMDDFMEEGTALILSELGPAISGSPSTSFS